MSDPRAVRPLGLELVPCRCCGRVPVWLGAATWCACEPPPCRTVVSGQDHECTFERRLHRHWFGRLIAEEDQSGMRTAVVFACACGQARRLEVAA